ncbi:cupredoxin domain-containing protein [Oscillochloris sp. ZM17-4]|uniref:cupredoxin domain-containing protein n=1 Tax=Oscillochloris sp. ZM17-4 TaxID=2866714 RepID=UPI001C73D497|nr:sulfocyanin-like copper-binding protein [Oscillochloris sp. ZM17-4]MBX0326489.1 cupredoxin domain-containing protein [Oscillochloris sp. ZM17-4]
MKRLLKTVIMASMLGLMVLAVAGCGGNASAGPVAPKESTVNVELVSFSVTPDVTTVPAGKVTFRAKNVDVVTHEMLVVPIVNAAAALTMPYDKTISRIPEDKITSLGEIPEIDGGTSGEVTLDLAPGTYILFCNLVSHYESGMHTVLTVTE